jgi:uncharacterized protein (TIGR03790 family)
VTRALHGPLAAMLAAACLLAGCTRARPTAKRAPATPAERVLVVMNGRSAAGDSVARHYMRRRGIDRSHLVRVDVPDADEIGDGDFREKILEPVRRAIDSLPVRIDFVVLTTGVPLRIGGHGYSVDAHLAGMRLPIPPMVEFDTAWLGRYHNPYYGAREPFSSERFAMYLVTRLDCERLADCIALVDRSLDARPARGPFFFDAMPFAGIKSGYEAMNATLVAAAQRLGGAGLDAVLDTSPRFVAPPVPLMGYASWGSNDAAFDAAAYRALRFLPGAIAETFVSTSARTFRPVTDGQSRIADLVAQGVTGVKGYVSEPYTVALADPAMVFTRYLSGFTLAESFYAGSRMVLWKDVVIGDPLCAPYARPAGAAPDASP